MLELEVLVVELGAVNWLSASSITSCEITTLNHELLDDSVESGAFIWERLSSFANSLLAGAESSKVLSCLRDNIIVELEGDSAFSLFANWYVEIDSTALLFFCHVASGFGKLLEGRKCVASQQMCIYWASALPTRRFYFTLECGVENSGNGFTDNPLTEVQRWSIQIALAGV